MNRAELQRAVLTELGNADLHLPERTRVSGPIYTGPFSEVFRFDLSLPMALKVCHHPETGAPDPAFARRQFEELSRIHRALGDDPRYRVPRPILLIESSAVLGMEWVAGEKLSQRLRLRLPPHRIAASLRQAGGWLRRFHDRGPRSLGPLAAADRLAVLRQTFASRAPRLVAAPWVGRGLAALERALPRVDGAAVERSWIHGDFQIDNVVLDGPAVIALDVAFSREDAAAVDAACLLNSLDRFLLLPKGWHLLPLRRRLTAAFLSGYSGSRTRVGPGKGTGLAIGLDPAALAWLRMHELLRFLALFHAAGRSPLHDRYFAASVRRLLRLLAGELEQAGSRQGPAESPNRPDSKRSLSR